MEAQKLAVKLFFAEAASEALAAERFVNLFHQWIQNGAIADHLLIDVVDYKHVIDGPGTVLVAHEANFSTDGAGGRAGLLYQRKQPLGGDFATRLRATFAAALDAAALIEQSPVFNGQARFRTDEIVFRIYDRLLAPNDADTLAQVEPALLAFAKDLYGRDVTIAHQGDGQTVFEVIVTAAGSKLSATELAKRVRAAVV